MVKSLYHKNDSNYWSKACPNKTKYALDSQIAGVVTSCANPTLHNCSNINIVKKYR